MAVKKETAQQAAEAATQDTKDVQAEKRDTEVIHLFKDNGRYSSARFVSVNGEAYLIQRGVDVEVPAAVAEVLRQCDARLRQTVVNRSACGDFDAVGADMAGDGLEYDTQLLAPDAFSALYQHWLCAQMDLALGETARAVNELQMYSDYCQEFAAWMRQKYPPAGGVQWRY